MPTAAMVDRRIALSPVIATTARRDTGARVCGCLGMLAEWRLEGCPGSQRVFPGMPMYAGDPRVTGSMIPDPATRFHPH
jgi:hypothetical protein